MVIRHDGNVSIGLGTTGGSYTLTVNDQIGIKREGVNAYGTLQMSGAGPTLSAPSGYAVSFKTNSTERMRIRDGGIVIGHSTTSDADLEVFNLSNDSEASAAITAQSSGGNTSTLRLRANRNDTKGNRIRSQS